MVTALQAVALVFYLLFVLLLIVALLKSVGYTWTEKTVCAVILMYLVVLFLVVT